MQPLEWRGVCSRTEHGGVGVRFPWRRCVKGVAQNEVRVVVRKGGANCCDPSSDPFGLRGDMPMTRDDLALEASPVRVFSRCLANGAAEEDFFEAPTFAL